MTLPQCGMKSLPLPERAGTRAQTPPASLAPPGAHLHLLGHSQAGFKHYPSSFGCQRSCRSRDLNVGSTPKHFPEVFTLMTLLMTEIRRCWESAMPSSTFPWGCGTSDLRGLLRHVGSAPDTHSWQVMHAVIHQGLFTAMSCFKSRKPGKKQHLNAARKKQSPYKNKCVRLVEEVLFFLSI